MKSISKMLERSDLSGKDRILLRIHDDINEMQTGKSILTESDIYNLAEGWKPKDDFEARQYNKYLDVWKPLKFVNTDIQTIFLNAVIDIGNVEKVLLYFVFKDPEEYDRFLTDEMQNQNQDAVLKILLENTGFEYEAVLHKMTFDSLPKNIQEDLLSLYGEAEYDQSYLRDEENVCTILKDRDSLSPEEIEKLTNIIMDTVSWEFEDEVILNERFLVRKLMHSYFAGVPMKIFVEKMAKDLGINYKDEAELLKKLEKVEDIKSNFRKAVKDKIAQGIFFSDYIPLCNSTDFSTCSGADTKLPHNELLDIWMTEKSKSKQLLQKNIDSGKLVLESRGKKIFTKEKYTNILTGKSMYHSKLDLPFVREYRQQIEQMLVFGHLIHLMNGRSFTKYYQNILAYHELLKKVSEIIEKDITFMSLKYLKDLDEEIDQLDKHVHMIYDRMMDHIYMNSDTRYYLEVYVDDMIVDRKKLQPEKYAGQKLYEREVSKNFGTGWIH